MSSLNFALIFFILLVILNYRAHSSVLYPPFIFCAMWLLDLVVVRLGLVEVDPIHGNTLVIVAFGAAAFSAGGLFAGLAPRKLLRIHIHLFLPGPKRTPDFLRNMMIIVLLCGLPVLYYQTLQLSKTVGGDSNILAQARVAMVNTALSEETSHSLVLNNFTIIATFSSLLFATEKRDRKFWVVTVVAFIGCILSTGRIDLLILISGLSAIYLLQEKKESMRGAMRLLRWPIALFVTLFIVLAFTNKNTVTLTGGVTDGVTDIATYSVLGYIVGPLAAFDKVVQHPAEFIMTTSHTFQYPLALAATLHLTNYTRPTMLDSYVYVPFPINVYTVFKFYFLELGTVGSVILLFIVGLLHSLLYLKARQGGRLSTFLFAYCMFPVLMVIFDDHYYIQAIYLRAIAFALFYFFVGSVSFSLFPANWQRISLLAKRRRDWHARFWATKR
jgi:oligosaccharide repeat unit polymerase